MLIIMATIILILFGVWFFLGGIAFILGIVFLVLYLLFKIFIQPFFFKVHQQEIYVIERSGKFNRIATAGINCKIPFIEKIKNRITLRVRQLSISIETKTFDDVYVKISTCVQFCVSNNKFFEAFYTLDDPEKEIQNVVFDMMRARISQIKLYDVFSKKDEITHCVKEELKDVMSHAGFDIIKVFITNVSPSTKFND
jgi:regulator of protease activity HflC (stomatin/prohibitin superfamily)